MYQFIMDTKTGKIRIGPILILATIILFIFVSVVGLNRKNTEELTEITKNSMEAQLIAVAQSASKLIDLEAYMHYTSEEAMIADKDTFNQVLGALSSLGKNVGAQYICVLREIDGEYYFIFDTDSEVDTTFEAYELSDVHRQAFGGTWSAGIMNVQDEYGSFNTGAVPIYYAREIVGIVCVDYEDRYLSESMRTAAQNQIILVVTLLAVLAVLAVFLILLLRRLSAAQQDMRRLAEKDALTGLPNRVYLFGYLDELNLKRPNEPFAMIFIDLDNFKQVNDSAGHDAGDELLRKVADFLQEQSAFMKNEEDPITFRPSAGLLNVSARVGGDEFIQVFPGAATEEDGRRIAEFLLRKFKTGVVSRYVDLYQVSLSIGVAFYPYHADNHHVLIKYADTAMYHAKKAGKNQFRVYTDGLLGKDDEIVAEIRAQTER